MTEQMKTQLCDMFGAGNVAERFDPYPLLTKIGKTIRKEVQK